MSEQELICWANLLKLYLITFLFLSLLASKASATVIPGVIDLRTWDSEQGPMALNVPWLFWKDQLFTKSNFSDANFQQATSVSGYWDGEGFGFGTYYLKILLPDNNQKQSYSIASRFIISSGEIDVLNSSRPTIVQGKVATKKSEGIRWDAPRVDVIKASGVHQDELELLVRVSNWDYCKGGIRDPFKIGKTEDLVKDFRYQYTLNAATAAILLILGGYHLVLFLLRTESKFTLMFALMAIFTAIRAVITGRLIESSMDVGPVWYASISYKVEYLSLVLGPYFLYLFFHHLIPSLNLSRYFSKFLTWASVALCGCAAILDYKSLSSLLPIFQIEFLSLCAYLIVKLTWHAFKGKNYRFESRATLIFLVLSVCAGVNDALYINGVINSVYLITYSQIIFFLGQSFVLARNFSNAFTRVDQLHKELIEKERARTLFFQNTSHELRTPLNGILGFVQLLDSGHYGGLQPKMRGQIIKIGKLAENLMYQVNTILDLAKTRKGELKLINSRVSCTEMLEDIKILADGLALKYPDSEYQLKSNFSDDDAFVGDREKLMTIIRNLIEMPLSSVCEMSKI